MSNTNRIGVVCLTSAQVAHEGAIDSAQRKLLIASSKPDMQIYWKAMVAGIKSRDPEVTDAMEQQRLRRAGL